MRCKTGKRCYRDDAEAKRSLRLIKASDRPNKGHKPCRWYECEECGMIHLTSQWQDSTVGIPVSGFLILRG